MKKGEHRVFDDKDKLLKLFKLRRKGLSFQKIANVFNCDYSSIMYQVNKSKGKVRQVIRGGRKIRGDACQECELLYISKHFCKECKDKKE